MTPETPYTSPNAQLTEAGSVAHGSSIKAVLVGVGVDVIGTHVASTLIVVAFAVIWVVTRMTPDQIEEASQNISKTSPFGLTLLAFGIGVSVLSGYLCARVAKRWEYRLAAITGVLSWFLSLATKSTQADVDLEYALLLALSLCAVFVGGHLGARRNRLGS